MPTDTTVASLARTVGARLHGVGSAVVDDVVHDSRDARPGAMFCALRGFTVDGHRFVDGARDAGAVAALVEDRVDVDLPQLEVSNSRRAMADVAAEVHGHPSTRMKVIGITGTNGKTTATYMLESIATAAGLSFGRIGTLGATIDGEDVVVARTTPESTDLQRLLARMADGGVDLVAMEVSSHALALHRADAVRFAVGAFTNLSQDHLDFHRDMDEYFAAKKQLFDGRAETHVVGTFDRAGAALADGLAPDVTVVGFDEGAHVRASDVVPTLRASELTLHVGSESRATTVVPGGRFNVANALVAAACASAVGISIDAIAEGLSQTRRVPGRLDPVDVGQPFTVVVDYAHSPAGVETVVDMAREVAQGRIIAVVGSAGDRDAAKRPLMGEAAGRADVAVITSDNPRTEDPEALVAAVLTGTGSARGEVIAETDRTAAIRAAIDMAEPGDAVLILGKGHEQGQDFGDHVIPFDDRDVARSILEERWP